MARDLTSKGYRKMMSRYDGFCGNCQSKFARGTEIWYRQGSYTIHAADCEAAPVAPKPAPAATVEPGVAAARACRCNCDGWCEDCSSAPCMGIDHRQFRPAAHTAYRPRRDYSREIARRW